MNHAFTAPVRIHKSNFEDEAGCANWPFLFATQPRLWDCDREPHRHLVNGCRGVEGSQSRHCWEWL